MDHRERLRNCILDRLCKLMNLTTSNYVETGNNANDLFQLRSSFFQILLPIILVFGIFIAIAIGLMARR